MAVAMGRNISKSLMVSMEAMRASFEGASLALASMNEKLKDLGTLSEPTPAGELFWARLSKPVPLGRPDLTSGLALLDDWHLDLPIEPVQPVDPYAKPRRRITLVDR